MNRLQSLLPEGRLATSAWLGAHGYSRQLVGKYAASGWLQAVQRGVYRRPGPLLKWQHVVASLGELLEFPPHVGGLSALELRGYAHFVKPKGPGEIHLYGARPLPAWVFAVPLGERLVFHPDRLFVAAAAGKRAAGAGAYRQSLTREPWGSWDWDLPYSTPERAILELLEQVPRQESAEHADAIIAGLADLSSRRLVTLLADCRSIKVKRLFLALASRHRHPWVRRVEQAAERGEFALGRGKRMLVPGGRLHPKYRITLPAGLDVPGE